MALKLNMVGKRNERELHPRPIGSAVEGLPGGLLRLPGYRTARRLIEASVQDYSAGGFGFFCALRRLSPPNRKISEFSTSRSAMAVAMVVLYRMLPQSENAVFVVIIVERFWPWRVEMTW